MRVVILGSAAGGGLPQWNCGCPNCARARRHGTGRTQSSVAVSADLTRWILLNASPDLRQQLAGQPALWPRSARGSPISAVVLTDAEIDHTLGLLLLRESAVALSVYAAPAVTAVLGEEWPVQRILAAYAGTALHPLIPGEPTVLRDSLDADLGISCTPFAMARRPPRFVRGATHGVFDIGLRLEDPRTGGVLAYIPTAGAVDESVRGAADGAGLLLFDGTFWSDDELRCAGVDAPGAREMGHLPVGGPGGSLDTLGTLGARRTALVHINNTNPILDEESSERRQVESAGIEVAGDGMEFEL